MRTIHEIIKEAKVRGLDDYALTIERLAADDNVIDFKEESRKRKPKLKKFNRSPRVDPMLTSSIEFAGDILFSDLNDEYKYTSQTGKAGFPGCNSKGNGFHDQGSFKYKNIENGWLNLNFVIDETTLNYSLSMKVSNETTKQTKAVKRTGTLDSDKTLLQASLILSITTELGRVIQLLKGVLTKSTHLHDDVEQHVDDLDDLRDMVNEATNAEERRVRNIGKTLKVGVGLAFLIAVSYGLIRNRTVLRMLGRKTIARIKLMRNYLKTKSWYPGEQLSPRDTRVLRRIAYDGMTKEQAMRSEFIDDGFGVHTAAITYSDNGSFYADDYKKYKDLWKSERKKELQNKFMEESYVEINEEKPGKEVHGPSVKEL